MNIFNSITTVWTSLAFFVKQIFKFATDLNFILLDIVENKQYAAKRDNKLFSSAL